MKLVITVIDIKGRCPAYKVGDKIVLDNGYKFNLQETTAACMHSLALCTRPRAYAHTRIHVRTQARLRVCTPTRPHVCASPCMHACAVARFVRRRVCAPAGLRVFALDLDV